MVKFTRSLKKRARQLAERCGKQWDTSIPGIVRREIALVVDQISQMKKLHEEQMLRLLRIECYVNTDLMQLEQHIPRYAFYHFPEKEKLQKRLFDIEGERRRLRFRLADSKRASEDRLLDLVNRHELVDG